MAIVFHLLIFNLSLKTAPGKKYCDFSEDNHILFLKKLLFYPKNSTKK